MQHTLCTIWQRTALEKVYTLTTLDKTSEKWNDSRQDSKRKEYKQHTHHKPQTGIKIIRWTWSSTLCWFRDTMGAEPESITSRNIFQIRQKFQQPKKFWTLRDIDPKHPDTMRIWPLQFVNTSRLTVPDRLMGHNNRWGQYCRQFSWRFCSMFSSVSHDWSGERL